MTAPLIEQDRMTEHKYRFAYALVELRGANHLTQQELAERLGFSPQYICDLESGRRMPSIKIVNAIVDKLGRDGSKKFWHRMGAMAHGWKI